MDNYTIIEDIFGDDDRNQITAARGFIGRSHLPDDMRVGSRGKVGKVSERPDMPDLEGRDSGPSFGPSGGFNQQRTPQYQQQFRDTIQPMHQPMMDNQFGGNQNFQLSGPQFSGPVLYPGVDSLQCRDVFTHVENCPICSNYFKKDVKFYWLIIAILILIILLLTQNKK